MILIALGIATGPAWRATRVLAAQTTVAPRASDRDAPAEVPCTQLRSAMHGVMLIGARLQGVGGPACEVMREYADWLQRSDTLLTSRRRGDARFTGREWDFATGAMRLGAPRDFFLIRGDSLSVATPGRPRRLFLSAFAADSGALPSALGAWFVLVDEDSASTRMFRSPVSARRIHPVLTDGNSLVYALGGVQVDGTRVRAQLAGARALRRALGFDDPLPPARFIVGPARDSTLAMLGVIAMERPLFAMMVSPPLAVFAPLPATGGLDPHELVHVATIGRRDVVPGSVGEAFAMHHGGSHGRTFAEAFCSSGLLRTLPPLDATRLDSALAGQWWNDFRSDVAGYALGHAMGWFIESRGDSAWIFAEGEPVRDNDAIGFLAARAGISRDSAMARIVPSFAARRAACPPVPPASPPSGAAVVPAPGSR
jgi:hypothetical protein